MVRATHGAGVRAGAWLLAVPVLACALQVHAAGSNPRAPRAGATYENAEPVTDPEQAGEWLLRLVGRYRVDGSVFMLSRVFEFRDSEGEMREGEFQARLESVRGTIDCVPVGAGPGLHCIFNLPWLEQHEVIMDPDAGPVGIWSLPGGDPYLNPAMMLVGLDLAKQQLSFQLVDNKGLPERGSGSIAGNRATLRAPCVNAPPLFAKMNPAARFNDRPPQSCERIMRIDAGTESRSTEWSTSIEINGELVTQMRLSLRRERK
jgi:hypothetical protein